MTSTIVCVSESEKEAAIRAGISPAKLRVIRNGVDCEALSRLAGNPVEKRRRLGLAGEESVVGFVGRLAPQKGVEYMIRAAPNILREFPATRFVAVGGGPLKEKLQQEARRLGIGGRCHFPGAVADAREVMAAFTVLVLPSRWESAPYALLEAMALGIPAVASNVGGIPEIIAGEDVGLIVPPENPDAIAGAVCSLLRDPQRRQNIARAAKQHVRKHFALDAMVSALQKLYSDLIDAPGTT